MSLLYWSARSLADLEAIKIYISHDSPRYAESYVLKLVNYANKIISTFPNLGRVVPESNIDHIKEVFFDDYRIIYSILKESISVQNKALHAEPPIARFTMSNSLAAAG